MSDANSLPSERVAVIGVINPAFYDAETTATDYVDLSLFRRIQVVLQSGVMNNAGGEGGGVNVDAVLEVAHSPAGAGATDLTESQITRLRHPADDNKQVVINLDTAVLRGTYRFVRLRVDVTEGAANLSAVVLGFDAMYEPASDNDRTSVKEIISV